MDYVLIHCSILSHYKNIANKESAFWPRVYTKLRFTTPKCHMLSVLSLFLVDGNITRTCKRKHSVFIIILFITFRVYVPSTKRSLNIVSKSTREKEKLHDICTLTIISFGKERNVAFSKIELLGYAACQDLNWKICICWWILYFRLCNFSLSSRILSTPLFPWDYVNSMPKKTFT